jgi:hypothetical protein
MPKPVETLPKGLKIERPDDRTGYRHAEANRGATERRFLETREPVDESPADDDLKSAFRAGAPSNG